MDKAELLRRMRESHVTWDALLAEVGPERMTLPGVAGEWTAKDLVAHVAVYERWTAWQMERALRGETVMVSLPEQTPATDVDDQDERNAAFYQIFRDQPLDETLAQARASYDRLLAAVNAFPDDLLANSDRFEWSFGIPVWRVVASGSFAHEEGHIAHIRAWLLTA
ncbi:MAG: ClbS/DfsB family four-helix bundle protein [Ktedonobacterales bacterium]